MQHFLHKSLCTFIEKVCLLTLRQEARASMFVKKHTVHFSSVAHSSIFGRTSGPVWVVFSQGQGQGVCVCSGILYHGGIGCIKFQGSILSN